MGETVGEVKAKFVLENHLDSEVNKIGQTLTNLETKAQSTGAAINNSFGSSFSSLGSKFTSLGNTLVNGLGGAFSSVGSKISSFGSSISSSVGGALSSVGSKIASFGGTFSTAIGSSLDTAGIKVEAFGKVVSQGIGSAFETVGSKISSFGTSILSGISAPFQKAGTVINGFVSYASQSLGQLNQVSLNLEKTMGYLGVVIVGIFTDKLYSAMQQATEVFLKFDDQMRKVQAVTDSTGEVFDKLTANAKLLGATTSYTAQEAAESMTQLAQAGFKADQVMAAMPNTLNLARGSMTSLSRTAEIMAAIMNGFQVSADDTARVSDVLAKAANATATDVSGLGEAMKYTSALAHQMGWSLEETAAAEGLLSNAGIKNSMAGTVLRNSITRLIAPTDKAREILASYGVTMDMVNPKTHDLAEILDVLGSHAVSTGDLMTIFGLRAGPGMLALINQGTGALRNMTVELQNSAGYAQKAADEMDAGWGGTMRRFGDTIEALQLTFGKALATIATPFIEAISKIGYVISQLPSPIIYAATAVGILTVAIGALTVALGTFKLASKAFEGVGVTFGEVTWQIASAISKLVGSSLLADLEFEAASMSAGALLRSLAPLGIEFVALAGVLYLVEEKTHLFSNAWIVLKDLITIALHDLSVLFREIKQDISDFIDGVKEALDDSWIGNFINSVENAYNEVSSFFGGIKDSVHETAEAVRTEDEKAALSAENVQKSIEKAHQGVSDSSKTTSSQIGSYYADMIENAGDYSDAATGANDDVISSNSDLISSNGEVAKSIDVVRTSASAPIKLSLEQTDIASMSAGSKLTMDDFNKGIEVADGGFLKLNEKGELIYQAVDKTTKRLYEMGNVSFETASKGKVWTFGGTPTDSSGKTLPMKTLADKEPDDNRRIGAGEATRKDAEWQATHPNDTMLYLNKTSGSAPSRALTEHEKELISKGQWKKPITEMPNTSNIGAKSGQELNILHAKEDNLTKDQVTIKPEKPPTKDLSTYLREQHAIKDKNVPDDQLTPEQQYQRRLWQSEQSGGKSTLKSSKSSTGFFDGLWSKITELLTPKDLSGQPIAVNAAGFDISGITKSLPKIESVKKALSGLNSVSFSGLKNSISGYIGKFDESIRQNPTVKSTLDKINTVSYDGIKTSIGGYIDKFDESIKQNPTVKSTLETINDVSYEGIKTSIGGYISKFDESIKQSPTVKSALDTINGISYDSLKQTIQGYMDKFTETATNMPGVKTGLEIINGISYESLKTTIQGVINKFTDTITNSNLVKIAISTWNSISFGGLTSAINAVKSTINTVVEAAKNMYYTVMTYVAKAKDYISGTNTAAAYSASQMTASEKATRAANNTVYNNSVNVGTINNNGSNINSTKTTLANISRS